MMKAVVMAGGEGSRLRPLTSRLPKPLAPVANKPVMEHIVELLRKHGITEIVATLHYLADEIETYFEDGSALGVTMHYVVEDTPLGTAGAVKMAEHLLGDDTFLIVSGDALTDMDLSALLAHHRDTKASATIALQRVTNPLEYGVVVTDHDGKITRFLEKPSWGEVFSDTINTGVYVLEPSVLKRMERNKVYDFSKDIFPELLRDGETISGWIADAYWTDIGSLEAYQQANYDAVNGTAHATIAGTESGNRIFVGEETTIDPSARLEGPLVIGTRCTIAAGAQIIGPAVIGHGVMIEANARVQRSVVWNDTYIGEEAAVDDCTVADRNTIEKRAQVRESSVLGRGCTIGAGALIQANLKLWPDKWVTSGSIVSMSLIYGQKWPGSLFGSAGIRGLANLEITPEFALKLGQAFGSSLKPGQVVMTSRDTHPAARVMNRCIISGLLSVGIHVMDLRSYPLPLARYATRVGGDGGVHVRVAPDDPNEIIMEFFDTTGITVDKAAERKIENLFFREDFRRTPMDDVGSLDFPSRALERYTSSFIEALKDDKSLAAAKFRVVIDYGYGNASIVLPQILGTLGVEQIALSAYFDAAKVRTFRVDRERHLQELASVVSSISASFGILIDSDGETFALVDDTGRIIGRNTLMALMTLLVARSKKGARIAMPLTVPSAVETVAQENGAQLIRARSDRRALMALAASDADTIAFVGGAHYEMIFPEFQPAFDGLYGAVKVMQLLAKEDKRLSELVDLLPSWHVDSRIVFVPWDRKGEVMRSLHDEATGTNGDVETLDGLRMPRPGGWVLVLPDASEASVNVFAEGPSHGDASRYVDEIAQRVRVIAGV